LPSALRELSTMQHTDLKRKCNPTMKRKLTRKVSTVRQSSKSDNDKTTLSEECRTPNERFGARGAVTPRKILWVIELLSPA
jgi:hypothetical protein